MKIYVGITDNNWYSYVVNIQPDEVNFSQPGRGFSGSISYRQGVPGSNGIFFASSRHTENVVRIERIRNLDK